MVGYRGGGGVMEGHGRIRGVVGGRGLAEARVDEGGVGGKAELGAKGRGEGTEGDPLGCRPPLGRGRRGGGVEMKSGVL